MLSNLTKRLIESTWNEKNKEVMAEGAMISSYISKIERYSHLNESVDTTDLEERLNSVTVNNENAYVNEIDKLYEACMNESITIEKDGNDDKLKVLTMSKDDYDKIISFTALYKKSTELNEKNVYMKKLLTAINTIKANIDKADEVDTFTNNAVKKICSVLSTEKPDNGVDVETVKSNIKKIKNTAKYEFSK